MLQFFFGIGREANITKVCVEGFRRISEDRFPVVIYTGHSFWSPAKFEKHVLSDMKIKGTSVSPSLSVALTSISTILSSGISACLYLPQPVGNEHFNIEAFRWCITVNTTLRGINEILIVGCLPHQPSPSCEDVSTPEFDRALVIVIPSHIFESVWFPDPESLIIWLGSHELLAAMDGFEAWEMQSSVFFLQHIFIVRLPTLSLDPTLDIFVLFMCHKRVVGIVL